VSYIHKMSLVVVVDVVDVVEAGRQTVDLRLLLYSWRLVPAVQGVRGSTRLSATHCAQLWQGL